MLFAGADVLKRGTRIKAARLEIDKSKQVAHEKAGWVFDNFPQVATFLAEKIGL